MATASLYAKNILDQSRAQRLRVTSLALPVPIQKPAAARGQFPTWMCHGCKRGEICRRWACDVQAVNKGPSRARWGHFSSADVVFGARHVLINGFITEGMSAERCEDVVLAYSVMQLTLAVCCAHELAVLIFGPSPSFEMVFKHSIAGCQPVGFQFFHDIWKT